MHYSYNAKKEGRRRMRPGRKEKQKVLGRNNKIAADLRTYYKSEGFKHPEVKPEERFGIRNIFDGPIKSRDGFKTLYFLHTVQKTLYLGFVTTTDNRDWRY